MKLLRIVIFLVIVVILVLMFQKYAHDIIEGFKFK